MDNITKSYMKLLKAKDAAEDALRGLNAVRPPTNELMNPEEASEASTEWVEMYNYYTNRLENILEEMSDLEAILPSADECNVHQLAGNGAGLCSTASRYSVPTGNGCAFCLRDQHALAKSDEEENDADNE